jgi:hypothetical protein
MACKKHKYGNGGQVKVHFADGGQVELPKPKKAKGKRKKITTKGKPGDTGPWGATPARDKKG